MVLSYISIIVIKYSEKIEVYEKKLLLINLANLCRAGLSVNKSSRFPPLGLGIIAALTPDDWEVKILDENFEIFKFEKADFLRMEN